MPTFSFLRLPNLFTNVEPHAPSSWDEESPEGIMPSAAGTACDEAEDLHPAMPGAFNDSTEESHTSPSLCAPSSNNTPESSTTSECGSDDHEGIKRITLRELIEDVAEHTIHEHNTTLARNLAEHLDGRIDEVLASTDNSMKEFMRVMKGIFDGGLSLAEGRMKDATSNAEQKLQNAQSTFFLKANAQDMKTRLRNEINNESLRCNAAHASLDSALSDALKRITSVEMEQTKIQSQLKEANELRAKDVTTIIQLRTELSSAREVIAALSSAAVRRDSMLNTMKLDVAESSKRADFAMSKAKALEEHVQRWLGEELRKKREAEEAARQKREEEERRKQADEAARLEQKKKREAVEAEQRRREAEAREAEQAEQARLREEARREEEARVREEARLKEEARKAQDEKRRRAQEQSRRDAEAERQRKAEEELARSIREAPMLARWALYQAPHAQGELRFDNIVWPVFVQPTDLSGLTCGAIDYFLFSEIHSKEREPRQRFKDAIKRWHSDKYAAIESRVKSSHRAMVKQAFHDISVHLNALNARYS
ncbi:unnamed protein product [Peniophora sp. CBMAI 1063]|nr:unnamed protein product [Peniophora sp. CBMAI 1063]